MDCWRCKSELTLVNQKFCPKCGEKQLTKKGKRRGVGSASVLSAGTADITLSSTLSKKLTDYERFKDERVKIKTRLPILERKNCSGIIKEIKGNIIFLESEGSLIEINFDQIDKARLDPK